MIFEHFGLFNFGEDVPTPQMPIQDAGRLDGEITGSVSFRLRRQTP